MFENSSDEFRFLFDADIDVKCVFVTRYCDEDFSSVKTAYKTSSKRTCNSRSFKCRDHRNRQKAFATGDKTIFQQ